MQLGEQARLVLTDPPYNVHNVGHVTSQAHHREFAMAAGEMSREEFGTFMSEVDETRAKVDLPSAPSGPEGRSRSTLIRVS